jgi:NADP-reducing hydrogenase subunit HndB
MMKLKPEDLDKIAQRMRTATTLRDGNARARITVHMGTCGIASGAREIMRAFLLQIETRQSKDVVLTTSGCAGLCSHEPMATVEIEGESPVKYAKLDDEKVAKIFKEHVEGGTAVAELAIGQGNERIG